MSGWIIVDKRVSREQSRTAVYGDKSSMRYYGRNGWGRTVKEAVPFASKLDCDELLGATWQAIRRVVTAGARRTSAAAQADADNAELDGLRATDAEMAAAVARWQLRAELAETSYDVLRKVLDSTRHTLGATALESAEAAAMRVVSERDGAVRDLAELRRAIEVLTVRMGG